jgi:hypothetical protein
MVGYGEDGELGVVESEVPGENRAPLPICPSQIPFHLTSVQTQAAVAGGC